MTSFMKLYDTIIPSSCRLCGEKTNGNMIELFGSISSLVDNNVHMNYENREVYKFLQEFNILQIFIEWETKMSKLICVKCYDFALDVISFVTKARTVQEREFEKIKDFANNISSITQSQEQDNVTVKNKVLTKEHIIQDINVNTMPASESIDSGICTGNVNCNPELQCKKINNKKENLDVTTENIKNCNTNMEINPISKSHKNLIENKSKIIEFDNYEDSDSGSLICRSIIENNQIDNEKDISLTLIALSNENDKNSFRNFPENSLSSPGNLAKTNTSQDIVSPPSREWTGTSSCHSGTKTTRLPLGSKQVASMALAKENDTDKSDINKIENVWNCNICKKQFTKPNLLKNHIASHSDNRPFICFTCGTCFKYQRNLKEHLRLHDEATFVCSVCGLKFKQRSNLCKHESSHNGIAKRFSCHQCEKSYKQKCHLNQHIQSVHQGCEKLQCPHCEVKVKLKSSLQRHILQKHSDKSIYKCSECSRSFNNKHNYAAHLRNHSGYRPFKCNVCEKGFSTNRSLIRHKLIHQDYRPHKCGDCQKSFLEYSDLKRHLLVHAKSKGKAKATDLKTDTVKVMVIKDPITIFNQDPNSTIKYEAEAEEVTRSSETRLDNVTIMGTSISISEDPNIMNDLREQEIIEATNLISSDELLNTENTNTGQSLTEVFTDENIFHSNIENKDLSSNINETDKCTNNLHINQKLDQHISSNSNEIVEQSNNLSHELRESAHYIDINRQSGAEYNHQEDVTQEQNKNQRIISQAKW